MAYPVAGANWRIPPPPLTPPLDASTSTFPDESTTTADGSANVPASVDVLNVGNVYSVV